MGRYCMYTKTDVLQFCFDCFDKDSSGTIDEREFILLCQTVNNAAPMFPGNFTRALELFDVNEDGLIDFSEFTAIQDRFPMTLFPAFRFQDKLQKFTLGEREWVRIAENLKKAQDLYEYRD